MFRAGDHIHHVPSGEDWVLSCDEEDGEVIPAGWPEGLAKAADCTLVKAATELERLNMLKGVAAISGYEGGRSRGGMKQPRAQRQLDAMEPTFLGVTVREREKIEEIRRDLGRAANGLLDLHRLRTIPSEAMANPAGPSPEDILTPADIQRAVEGMEDFADFGIRSDLTPTMPMGPSVSKEEVSAFLLNYIKRIDDSVRERARYFLGLEPPKTEMGMVSIRPTTLGFVPGTPDSPEEMAKLMEQFPPGLPLDGPAAETERATQDRVSAASESRVVGDGPWLKSQENPE